MCGFNSSYSKVNLATFWILGVKTNSVMIPPVCLAGAFFYFWHVPFQKDTYTYVFGIEDEKDAHRNLGKIGGILSPQSLFWTLLVTKRVFARKWQNHGQSLLPLIGGVICPCARLSPILGYTQVWVYPYLGNPKLGYTHTWVYPYLGIPILGYTHTWVYPSMPY